MASVPHDAIIPWAAFQEVLLDLVNSKLIHRAGRDSERQAALPHELGTIREAYLRMHSRVFPNEVTGPTDWERLMSVGLDCLRGPSFNDEFVEDIHDAADRMVAS